MPHVCAYFFRQLRTILSLSLALLPLWTSAGEKPLKVFVLVGQSNMQGHAHVRTFEHVGMDPKTAPLLELMVTESGSPRECDQVWISYLSQGGVRSGRLTAGFGANEEKIGPEYTFGITVQEKLQEPVLIIKAAWGGKSLNTDFRSPSAGPYAFSDTQMEQFKKQGKDLDQIRQAKTDATGHYYRLTVAHVKETLDKIEEIIPAQYLKHGHTLAGFVWFQGWNDMVDRGTYPTRDQAGGYDAYSHAMAHFIRDVRRDLSAPELPFVIGVLGVGGPVEKYLPDQKRYEGIHSNFRSAMATPASMPEFRNNVAAVLTENYWDMELRDLRAKENAARQKARQIQREKKLDRKEQNALVERLREEALTDSERAILAKGVSNAEYHYLGSAKIMAQIGRGFAQAALELLRKR